jgi:DNA-binding transcriptional regulator YhcF (GntR family)
MKLITIQENSHIPKYKQIINALENKIKEGVLQINDKLPSVNKVALEFNLSRDTVLLAYELLKKRGLIYAVLGKGYYIKSTDIGIKDRVFLLFDELNSFKEDLYNAIVKNMGKETHVDIFFHHFNSKVFERQVKEANGNYSKYIIMPTNYIKNAAEIIAILPKNEVYIVDQISDDLKMYPAVYQNFAVDIYNGLLKGKTKLEKYNKLILVFPGFREPVGMKDGFLKFATDFNFKFEVLAEFKNRTIHKGEVFILPNDRDLVSVIEKSLNQNLKLQEDFGIISYNETPLKKLIQSGITTISTDFTAMGKLITKMTYDSKKIQVANRSELIMRNSL